MNWRPQFRCEAYCRAWRLRWPVRRRAVLLVGAPSGPYFTVGAGMLLLALLISFAVRPRRAIGVADPDVLGGSRAAALATEGAGNSIVRESLRNI